MAAPEKSPCISLAYIMNQVLSDEAGEMPVTESIVTLRSEKQEMLYRLQVGGAGLFGVFLIALVSSLIFGKSADEGVGDTVAVDETGAPIQTETQTAEEVRSEPLVDIGVVPDITPDESLGDAEEALPDQTVPDQPAPGIPAEQIETPPGQEN